MEVDQSTLRRIFLNKNKSFTIENKQYFSDFQVVICKKILLKTFIHLSRVLYLLRLLTQYTNNKCHICLLRCSQSPKKILLTSRVCHLKNLYLYAINNRNKGLARPLFLLSLIGITRFSHFISWGHPDQFLFPFPIPFVSFYQLEPS